MCADAIILIEQRSNASHSATTFGSKAFPLAAAFTLRSFLLTAGGRLVDRFSGKDRIADFSEQGRQAIGVERRVCEAFRVKAARPVNREPSPHAAVQAGRSQNRAAPLSSHRPAVGQSTRLRLQVVG